MANAKKTWISIVVAGVIVICMLVVAVIGTAALFLYRHVNTRVVPAETAAAEFARVRSGFAGQTPMIEIASDELLDAENEDVPRVHAIVHRERVAPGPIKALHVLAYDARKNKLVRADVPRWLLEFTTARGRLRIANLDVLPGTGERVTLDDFDRRGPGLVMNINRLRGSDVVVWTD